MKYLQIIIVILISISIVFVAFGGDYIFGFPMYIFSIIPFEKYASLISFRYIFYILIMVVFFLFFIALIFIGILKKLGYIYMFSIVLLFFLLNGIAGPYVRIGVSILELNFS